MAVWVGRQRDGWRRSQRSDTTDTKLTQRSGTALQTTQAEGVSTPLSARSLPLSHHRHGPGKGMTLPQVVYPALREWGCSASRSRWAIG